VYLCENCSPLGWYAACTNNSLPPFRGNISTPSSRVKNPGPLGCPETSARNYRHSLHNNPEERSSHLLHGRSLISHSVFMCFVWIWEQTAIISLYSINWLVFITETLNWLVCIAETECVYCAVRTECLYIVQVMCFVWISEQTAIISLYSINWLVCIAETECVYCAVRAECLYIVPVMCFVWISEQTAIISLYSINWLVFITETLCIYWAVRTE